MHPRGHNLLPQDNCGFWVMNFIVPWLRTSDTWNFIFPWISTSKRCVCSYYRVSDICFITTYERHKTQTFKGFCSLDAPFGSILKKYRRFATVHYSLVATSAVFAELKQFKSICLGNRHTHTDWLLAMHPRAARLMLYNNIIIIIQYNVIS